ncbi:unnamed protein product [Rotaria magnacalcarata]|uniref:Uncharacterized protein n=1 Tax=Rotaria magnacalcarata TaxID=392030 RepID=A0A815MBC0_9BILA|nr:unnamed protein product [Rotaria magnacalcarata]
MAIYGRKRYKTVVYVAVYGRLLSYPVVIMFNLGGLTTVKGEENEGIQNISKRKVRTVAKGESREKIEKLSRQLQFCEEEARALCRVSQWQAKKIQKEKMM